MREVATSPLNVLFLCTGNSARSIVAECLLNRLGRRKFQAFSAGSEPKGQIHPLTLRVLRKSNFDVKELRSKSWEEFARPDSPKLDFVFTVCDNAANEVCPVWPGQPMTAHWGVPDPAAVEGDEAEKYLAFADTMRMLNQRIGIFVNLPISEQDFAPASPRRHRQGRTLYRTGLNPRAPRRLIFEIPLDSSGCAYARNDSATRGRGARHAHPGDGGRRLRHYGREPRRR